MKTTIVLFTYRAEEEILPMQAAHFARIMPSAGIHIIDDADDPIPPCVVEQLREANPRLRYKQSHFNRGGNLNGGECIKGMLACMQSAAEEDGNTDGIIIKLDPDTLILRPDLITAPFVEGALWYASSSYTENKRGGLYSGMCYAMQSGLLDKVIPIAQALPWTGAAKEYPEDISICSLATLVCGRELHRHVDLRQPENAQYVGAFDVCAQGDDYTKAINGAAQACVVTVGNTGVSGLPSAYRVRFMADILDIYNQLLQQKIK